MQGGNVAPARLRAHHLVCMHFYEGKGYSRAFCENMARVIGRLDAVALCAGADDICAACDHFAPVCRYEEKSGAYDAAVMRILGLQFDKTYDYALLARRVSEEIVQAGLLSGVCADCEWFSICGGRAAKETAGDGAGAPGARRA